MTEWVRKELIRQVRERSPDEGTIVVYAIATHHNRKNLPDHLIAPPGSKVGLFFRASGRVKGKRPSENYWRSANGCPLGSRSVQP